MEFCGSKFSSMEISMEADGSRFASMEVCVEVGRSGFASMEVSESFHGNTWKFPLSVEVQSSIASIDCSFHEHIPWTRP